VTDEERGARMGDRESLALKDWSTLRMSENYGGCDAGTAGQRFALPLQIAMLGLQCRTQTSMGSSRLPAFSDDLRLEMRESVFVF
jgi:hypothetical protein